MVEQVLIVVFHQKVGGGGRSRTYDAANMSRVGSESILLELLAEILVETSAGDSLEP